MKKFIILLICILLLGTSYLALVANDVQIITTEIEISAPPSKVWEIIIDVNSWQDWSPIINASQGEANVGSTLNITMMSKEEEKDGPNYNPKITELSAPYYFRWRAHMLAGFIFTNDKIFELQETTSGTRFIHTETFTGLLVPIFRGQMKKGVPPMLDMMNKALKELAEKEIEL